MFVTINKSYYFVHFFCPTDFFWQCCIYVFTSSEYFYFNCTSTELSHKIATALLCIFPSELRHIRDDPCHGKSHLWSRLNAPILSLNPAPPPGPSQPPGGRVQFGCHSWEAQPSLLSRDGGSQDVWPIKAAVQTQTECHWSWLCWLMYMCVCVCAPSADKHIHIHIPTDKLTGV